MKKSTGLWIGKTGQANAWYHIYPFVESALIKQLHIVRYTHPQRKIESNKAIFHVFKANGYINQLFKYFFTGFKVLRTKDIDFIVSFNLIPWASLSWMLAKIFRKPLIIGLIGSDFHKYLIKGKGRFFLKFILNRTDVITTTGNKMMEYFKDNNYANNVFIYPHCLADEWFSLDVIKSDRKYDLITISELKGNKRTIDIINAVFLLKERGINLRLKILGVGPEMEMLKSKVEKLKLKDNVKFAGYQSNVTEHLLNAKIFIQASIHEGLSLSLIEALGAGVVPVITEAGSEKDVVSHDYDALFFKIMDTNDLVSKIEYAIDRENYNRIKNNILKTREKFRIKNAILRVEEIQRYLMKK